MRSLGILAAFLLSTACSSPVLTQPGHSWTSLTHGERNRYSELVVPLPDGRVVFAGGALAGRVQRLVGTTEIFDPKTRSWETLDEEPTLGTSQSAVLLRDGRILVVGGLSAFSGTTRGSALATVLSLDPGTGRWTPEQPLSVARSQLMLALLADGRVLAAGGTTDSGVTDVTEIFDPQTGRWSRGPSLPAPRTLAQSLTFADGRVLIVGGVGPSLGPSDPGFTPSGSDRHPLDRVVLQDSVVFDPTSQSWNAVAFPPAGYGLVFAEARPDGGIGGMIAALPPPSPDASRRGVPIVHPTTFFPFTLGSRLTKLVRGMQLPSPTDSVQGGVTEIASMGRGRLFALTGSSTAPKGLIYDEPTDSWSATDTPPIAGSGFHAAYGLVGGRILVIGGGSIALFDPNPLPIRTPVRELTIASPELSPWLTSVAATLALMVLFQLIWVRRPRRFKL